MIIESSGVASLLTGDFFSVHPWIGVNMIYLWNEFIGLLRTEALLTGFCCIIVLLTTEAHVTSYASVRALHLSLRYRSCLYPT